METSALLLPSEETSLLLRAFIGPNGLRAGWSIGIFLFVTLMAAAFLGTLVSFFVKNLLHIATDSGAPANVLIGQVVEVVALLVAAALCARLEVGVSRITTSPDRAAFGILSLEESPDLRPCQLLWEP